jgi:hypothetical protein
MYKYKMISIFEALSNKEALAEDDPVKTTDQKNQSAIRTKKEDEPA